MKSLLSRRNDDRSLNNYCKHYSSELLVLTVLDYDLPQDPVLIIGPYTTGFNFPSKDPFKGTLVEFLR